MIADPIERLKICGACGDELGPHNPARSEATALEKDGTKRPVLFCEGCTVAYQQHQNKGESE